MRKKKKKNPKDKYLKTLKVVQSFSKVIIFKCNKILRAYENIEYESFL